MVKEVRTISGLFSTMAEVAAFITTSGVLLSSRSGATAIASGVK
jgi:hypothetical protein